MNTSTALLQKIVEMAGGPADGGFVLALAGEGMDELPSSFTAHQQTWHVVRPETELGLRRELLRAGSAPLVALVPAELAATLRDRPDVLHRARGKRVHALEMGDILSVALGVPVVGTDDDDIQKLALDMVDALRLRLRDRTLPTVVDRQLLEDLLCDASLGESFRRARPPELLASWLRDGLDDWGPAIRKLVCSRVPSLHGTVGRVLAWALRGPGTELLEALVVHGALLDCDGQDLPESAWGPLALARMDREVAVAGDALRTLLADLASSTLQELGDDAQPYLTRAETIARKQLSPRALSTNRVLPLGLRNRILELAKDAGEGKALDPGEIKALFAHRAARREQPNLEVLQAMGRLSRYLIAPEADQSDPAGQIKAWRTSGAFADLAGMRLRRALASATGLHKPAAKMLLLWRSRRDAENRRWADALAADYESAYLSKGAVPLHRVAHRVLAPVAAEGKSLFLVVMDGCSFPVLLDLLDGLLGLHDSIGVDLARTEKQGPVALSPLPTITSHARGAIFLGQVPHDPLASEEEGQEAVTDKARLKQNSHLKSITRKLFLKGDLADGGVELQASLRGDEHRLVAAVFNAIDDQIGSSNTGAAVRVRPDDIAGFVPALQTALAAGREVLLTADHGHSPFVATGERRGKNKQPRFIQLEEKDEVPAGFVEIDVGGLGGEPGRKAFAWAMGAYLGRPQVGFHGGCGLEEMVVPLLWLKSNGVRLNEPIWWHSIPGDTAVHSPMEPDYAPKVAATKPKPARKAKVTAPAEQLSLIDPSGDQQLLAAGLSEQTIGSLDESERKALMAIAQNNEVKVSDLAAAIDRRPARIPGMMSRLQRRLHERGEPCFDNDTLPTGEPIYRWMRTGGQSR